MGHHKLSIVIIIIILHTVLTVRHFVHHQCIISAIPILHNVKTIMMNDQLAFFRGMGLGVLKHDCRAHCVFAG